MKPTSASRAGACLRHLRVPLFASAALLAVVPKMSATVSVVSVSAPSLSASGTTAVSSPVHFQATAESNSNITGYVIYIDNQNVYQNHAPALDAWVVLAPGASHSMYIKAWDSTGSASSTATYSIQATELAPPTPPRNATRLLNIDKPAIFSWEVDNDNGVGGQCNTGSIGSFANSFDPNTENSPDYDRNGQHFTLTSQCTYDDSLFYWKDSENPQPAHTNFLWDFWIYIPTTTAINTVQALEFDMFQAVQLSDGVHEFMFGSQCNYATNQFQFWLPQNGNLEWTNGGITPCQFAHGAWHHLTYFLQRVAVSGYQNIPAQFTYLSDTNTNLRFGTLTIDGKTSYLGALSNSTIPSPKWSPVLGIQHQLDSAVSGATLDEYVDEESLTAW